ncbi:MAG: hypothetical protein NZV14_15805 [Bryobacteraceae bacterium]|nr:hypothetical protein [Bryobacteraceae bacterium]MDW8379625.1 hypothetical protein [Bryobacterales bacterium]
MQKVLGRLANSPAACFFSIACGIGVMLSVASLSPTDTSAILLRNAVGAVFLLAPAFCQRFREQDTDRMARR